MKTFAVIGLGRFGTDVALELSRQGQEVLVLDRDEECVQAVTDRVIVPEQESGVKLTQGLA